MNWGKYLQAKDSHKFYSIPLNQYTGSVITKSNEGDVIWQNMLHLSKHDLWVPLLSEVHLYLPRVDLLLSFSYKESQQM